MTRRRIALMLPGALLWSGLLQAPVAYAQAAGTVPVAVPSFEEAQRLTWRRETRADGVAALRTLLASRPDANEVRFELGRVLTWNTSTRVEGVALLRRVIQEDPEWGAAEETLAEVLAWDAASRDEAVTRLRRLAEQEPERQSVRLKLAEVLSWNTATRDESEALYRAILREDETSLPATVGLARVLSWRGHFDESRVLYRRALLADPELSAAWIGLANLDDWSGQVHASLATLAAFPEATMETPEAHQLRAQAYTRIGRPARALDEYDQLLAIEPGNQSALDATRSLRQQLRPVLEIGGDGSTESGEPSTDRVRVRSVPLRFGFHPGGRDTEVSLSAAVSTYQNAAGESRDRWFGGGVDAPLGNRVRLEAEFASHDLDYAGRELTGQVELRVTPHDRFAFRLGAARGQLSSSRLSLAGEVVDGVLYGPSFAEEFMAGFTYRPGGGWDVWLQATGGRVRGENIRNNDREELFAGVGRTFRAGAVQIRPGYGLTWLSYARDLGGFPATDGAGDGTTARGVGGYFSPFRFLNQMARVDLTVPAGEGLLFVGGGGVGRQQIEDTESPDFSYRTTSSDAYFGLRVSFGPHVALRAQVNYQDVASAYDRTVARLTLGYAF